MLVKLCLIGSLLGSCAVLGAGATAGASSPPLQFAQSQTLHFGTEGHYYIGELPIEGGQRPISATIVGGSLPTGLELHSDGEVTGIPLLDQEGFVTVQVTDSSTPPQTITGPVGFFIGNPANPAPAAVYQVDDEFLNSPGNAEIGVLVNELYDLSTSGGHPTGTGTNPIVSQVLALVETEVQTLTCDVLGAISYKLCGLP